jgi:hypothetical protein
MTRALALSIATLLNCAGPLAAQAETVYRCGNVYAQSPCAGAQRLDVDDPRSAAQRAEAERIVRAEQQGADRMERLRLAEAAAVRPAAAANLGRTAQRAPARSAEPKPSAKKRRVAGKAANGTDFIAFDPSSRKRRRAS